MESLQGSVSLCIYRVLQEIFHNIISHSQAKSVKIELMSNSREIVLRVIDDGVGFDASHDAEGLGLRSMQQRVRSEGGSIDIASTPNRGTRIEVRIPLSSNDIPSVA